MTQTRTRRLQAVSSALAALLASCALLAACGGKAGGGADESPARPASAGTIVVVSPSDIRGVNELVTEPTAIHTAVHTYALFLTLLDEQADSTDRPQSFRPRLAESYEFSADRSALTFRLRRDAVWSDGEPITADDVRWTWQAQTNPEVAWSQADSKRHIRDVEVVDPATVRFHFDEAYATQLLDVNLGVILPRHAWSQLPFGEWRARGDWFLDHLVVSGPFTLEEWVPGQRIVLARNERYFDRGRPRARRVVIRVTPERAGQLALLRRGEAQLVTWALPADAAALAEDPEIEIRSYVPRGVNGIIWNLSNPLFATKELRQALTLALDRQAIIDALYYGYARVSDSPFPSNLWAFNRQLTPWPHDPQRARELLATQGWSDGDGDGVVDRGGRRFSFTILTAAGNELREDILVMVQNQLAQVGVEARQRTVELNTLIATARSHEFEAMFLGLGLATNLDLSPYFHSSSADGGFNLGGYSDPETDRLLDELKDRSDQLAAKPIYDELQSRLKEELPMTVLYEPQRLVPIRKTLKNASPNALSTLFGLEEWQLAEQD